MRYRTRMTGLVLGLATTGALLAAGLAGCGGGGKPTGGPTPSAAPSGGQAQLRAYLSCLNQHGVKITLPSGRPTAFPSGFPGGRFRGGAGRSGRPTVRPTARPSGFGGGFGGGGFGGGGLGGIFGNGGQPPAGVSQATWQAAQSACSSVRPSFGAGRGGARADNGANAAYLNCLRDHGVIPSSGPMTARPSTANPSAQAGLRACAPLRPTGGPNPSPTG